MMHDEDRAKVWNAVESVLNNGGTIIALGDRTACVQNWVEGTPLRQRIRNLAGAAALAQLAFTDLVELHRSSANQPHNGPGPDPLAVMFIADLTELVAMLRATPDALDSVRVVRWRDKPGN